MKNSKSIYFVTNIPTPYRNYCYELMRQEFAKFGYDFFVGFMGWTEPGRKWIFSDNDFGYGFKVFDGFRPHLFGVTWYFNLRLLIDIVRKRPSALIVGGYHSPTHMLSILLGKINSRTTILWSESNSISERKKGGVASFIKSKLIKLAGAYYVPGNEAKKLLMSHGASRDESSYISFPNIINEGLYVDALRKAKSQRDEVRRKLGVNQGMQLWVSAARLEEIKGFQYFIPLLKEKKNVLLAIFGDGSQRESWERLAFENDVNLVMPGHAPENEMIKNLAAADLFVLPSLRDPSPLSIIEAIAAGLPVLASRYVGNFSEVVRHGKNGWCLQMDDVNSDVRTVNQISRMENKELGEWGRRSIDVYYQNFDSERIVKTVVSGTIKMIEENDFAYRRN